MAGSGFRRVLERGLADPRPLLLVWGITIILLVAGILWLELRDSSPDLAHAAPQREVPSEPVPADQEPTRTGRAAITTPDDPPSDDRPVSQSPDGSPLSYELAPVPQPDLIETVNGRTLPRISDDGRQPWRVYRRPFPTSGTRPLVALIIQDVGQTSASTEMAIGRLPPEVVLALSPYARDLDAIALRARQAGHELLLMVPMEPQLYPENDPGPLTLLADAPTVETIDRLHATMAGFQGYVGLINHMGSRFTADESAMLPVLEDIKRRGLLFLDARSTPASVAGAIASALAMPVLSNDRYIDNIPSAEEIDRQLAELVLIAVERGGAIGVGRPLPVTIERIQRWAGQLEARGVVLAPATALVGLAGTR